jgi:hypothetical protein
MNKKQSMKDHLLKNSVIFDKVVRSKDRLDIYMYQREVVAIHDKINDLIRFYPPSRSAAFNIEAKRKGEHPWGDDYL